MNTNLFEIVGKALEKSIVSDTQFEAGLADLITQFSSQKETITRLETQAVQLQEEAKKYGAVKENLTKDILRMSTILNNGKENKRDKLFTGSASYEELIEFQAELNTEMQKRFPATCQQCGSKITEVRSSIEPNAETQPETIKFKTIHGRKS